MRAKGTGFVFIFSLNLLLLPTLRSQENWRFNNRLQVGTFYDNNIFESVQNTENAMVTSAIFQTQGRRQFDKIRFSYSYSNSLQLYPQHGEEHKITQIANTEAVWPVHPKIQFSGTAGGTAKFFLNAPFDFILSHSSLRLQINLPGKFGGILQVDGTQLEYAETDQFDFFNRNYSASLQRRFSSRLLLESGYSVAVATFQRRAYIETEPGFSMAIGARQQDELKSIFLRCTAGRKYLFRLTGEYIQNQSNSIGYAYSGLRFSGIGAARFMDLWLLRMAVILQDKRYSEPIHPVNLLEFDLERSETNSAVVDLSYDFKTDLSALLRLSFYKNESGLRGRYYNKDLLYLALEYRF